MGAKSEGQRPPVCSGPTRPISSDRPVSLGFSSDDVAPGATRMLSQPIHANHAGRPTGSYDKHKRHVVLFKTPQSEFGPSADPYYKLLHQHGYETTFVPVLEDAYDTAELERVLVGGDVEGNRGERVNADFDGIIITSRRGAEGWLRAARNVQAADQEYADWSQVPLSTVGNTAISAFQSASTAVSRSESTGASGALLATSTPALDPRLIPSTIAYTAKSAESLLPLLLGGTLDDDGSSQTMRSKRYLFVRGDKSLNTLQPALLASGHSLVEIPVYFTAPRASLGLDISELSRLFAGPDPDIGTNTPTELDAAKDPEVRTNKRGTIAWLAFFSPSSAGYVLPLLQPSVREAMTIQPVSGMQVEVDGEEEGGGKVIVKVFAIGETTRKWLESQGVRVDRVAEAPDAGGLLNAING